MTTDPQNENQKWEKIISEQAEEQTPFILKEESFKSENQPQEILRQRSMMEQTAKTGRQLLLQKDYQAASKQLSKTLMAFEFIAKNNAQTIQKQLLKQMMIQTVLPAYNNLALCYLKLKNFDLVVTFTNQILAQDDGNIKARYRRALAFKELKNTEHAIKDFEFVKKLDPEMANDCEEKIKECKVLQIELKKKRKLAAQKFISGYQSDDIKPQNKQQPSLKQQQWAQKTALEEKKLGFLGWVKEKCQKCSNIFKNLRSGNKNQGEKEQ